MQKIIVADTSCLIILEKIDALHLLEKLFSVVTITDIIASEFQNPLPSYIRIKNPENPYYQRILETILDRGESSALALALENTSPLLIIDDVKGRKKAKSLDIPFTGTLGILLLAKQKGLIKSIKQVLVKIQSTNFKISQELMEKVIKLSGE